MFVTIRTSNGFMHVDAKKFLELKTLADLRKLLKIISMEDLERRREIKRIFLMTCAEMIEEAKITQSDITLREYKSLKRKYEEVLKFD